MVSWFCSAPVGVRSEPAFGARAKFAEGEYLQEEEFRDGPIVDTREVRNTWTLWRVDDHAFEVEERVISRWGAPGIAPREQNSRIRLSAELHPLALETSEGGNETLSCVFGEREVRCRIGGKDLSLSIEPPYDLFGASPWFYASIVRRGSRDAGRESRVRLFLIDNPPGMGAFAGTVRYLGEEKKNLAGAVLRAHKFLLDAGHDSGLGVYHVWVSDEGIPLAFGPSAGKSGLTELVRYERPAG